MASDDGAVRSQIIDILISVNIPEVSSLRTLHHNGSAAANGFIRAGRAVYSARKGLGLNCP
ncbi:Uncharacterised protein [Mycobacteroides abscessus subsp. abscessus]|nr:Uncharacterised protein [Mycobacteroides abscessus subsp. abscessus]